MTGIQTQQQSNAEGLFTPAFQDMFWANLDPNLSLFLDMWEERETWTWQFEDLPSFFVQLSSLFPTLAKTPIHQAHAESVNGLIQVLSTMPLRYAISAVSWLDSQNDSGPTAPRLSWGMLCFQEAARILKEDQGSDLHLWAKVFHARISVMARTQLATELFSQEIIKRSPGS